MLNAAETTAAEAALVYPERTLSKEDRAVAMREYRQAQNDITDQFRAYLADSYLSNFSAQVQDAVWNRVREEGGGYENMECNYDELADLLKLV